MKTKILALMISTSIIGLAHADPVVPGAISGSVEFTGNIVSDTCKISAPNGSSNGIINVNMGSVPSDEVGTVAAPNLAVSASADALTLTVTCKSDANVTMAFAALPSNVDTGGSNNILKLNTASSAKGVGIAVYPTGNKTALDLTAGKLMDALAVKANSPLQVQFDAAYVQLASSAGAVSPGTANASLPFVLSYN